jgi:hypothetical protein
MLSTGARWCQASNVRGRGFSVPTPSKIAQLPQELRDWLHRAFVERAFGDIEAITQQLNDLCKHGGVAISVGKSAVGAESLKVKRAQEAIRQTTEAAKLLADASRDDADTRGEAVMAMVQGEVFQLMLAIGEARDESDPTKQLKILANVAKAISVLSRARVNQSKWRTEVDTKVKAAADTVAKKLKAAGGLSQKQVDEIRASILGIGKRES